MKKLSSNWSAGQMIKVCCVRLDSGLVRVLAQFLLLSFYAEIRAER